MIYDVVIIGAGASGLMCAVEASKRDKKVLVVDHSKKIGKKILISGGGKCNFTNYELNAKNYISENEHFCKSAISRFNQWDFLDLVYKYEVDFEERDLGRLFTTKSSKEILDILLKETNNKNIDFLLGYEIEGISEIKGQDTAMPLQKNTISSRMVFGPLQDEDRATSSRMLLGLLQDEVEPILNGLSIKFKIVINSQEYFTNSLVIATGGLSYSKIGASDFGYKIAKQFDINIVKTDSGLTPLLLDNKYSILSGVAFDATVTLKRAKKNKSKKSSKVIFHENILFTHKGLSGPAILQVSLYWKNGDELIINLLPKIDIMKIITDLKDEKSKKQISTIISNYLPKKLVKLILPESLFEKQIHSISKNDIQIVSNIIHSLNIRPIKKDGYDKAEITLGGVDTSELSSKTMESKKVKGLYFIGEVIDVTGWLGGYNLQWAWSSGWSAGQYVGKND